MRYYLLSIVCLLNWSLSCKSSASSTANPKSGKKYLALGDSYTIGESVRASETYPQQLVDVWNKRGEGFSPPTIIARTGWTTGDLLDAIDRAKIKGNKYDRVSLLIGVNNQFQGRSQKEFEKEFTELIDLAIGFANDKQSIFVVSIPDYGYTPFGKGDQAAISPEIDQFNDIARRVAAEKGIRFVDITPISRKGLADPGLVAGDGLHPSAKMYAQFTELITKE